MSSERDLNGTFEIKTLLNSKKNDIGKFGKRVLQFSDEPTNDVEFYEYISDSSYKIPVIDRTSMINLTKIYDGIPYLQYFDKTGGLKYIFTLAKIESLNGRLHAIVYCTDLSSTKSFNVTKNKYYESRSDGHMWRYCTIDNDDVYYKGYDYVSTSFIHIQLQKYLFDVKKYFTSTIILDTSKRCIIHTLKPELNDRLTQNSSKYVSNNIFFKTIYTLFPTSIELFVQYSSTLEKLRIMCVSHVITDETRQSYIKLYDKIKINDRNRNIRKGESRREFYGKIYTILEELFNEIFKPYSSVRLIIKNFISETFGNEITSNIYEMDFICRTRNSDNGQIYTIRYMIYKIKINGISSESRKAILHIIPINSTITIYGLDSQYVATGMFVNKIYDYEFQAPITRTRDDPERTYTYIGDFINYNFLPMYSDMEIIDDALIRSRDIGHAAARAIDRHIVIGGPVLDRPTVTGPIVHDAKRVVTGPKVEYDIGRAAGRAIVHDAKRVVTGPKVEYDIGRAAGHAIVHDAKRVVTGPKVEYDIGRAAGRASVHDDALDMDRNRKEIEALIKACNTIYIAMGHVPDITYVRTEFECQRCGLSVSEICKFGFDSINSKKRYIYLCTTGCIGHIRDTQLRLFLEDIPKVLNNYYVDFVSKKIKDNVYGTTIQRIYEEVKKTT
jgi:hypothetical protein